MHQLLNETLDLLDVIGSLHAHSLHVFTLQQAILLSKLESERHDKVSMHARVMVWMAGEHLL